MPDPLSHEAVEAEVAKSGDKFHPDYYFTNTKTKLDIICQHCDKTYQVLLCNFRTGSRCTACSDAKEISHTQKREKHIEYMKQVIANYNFKLLNKDIYKEYKSQDTINLEVQCPNGHIKTKSWADLYGKKFKCRQCANDKLKLTKEKIDKICDDAGLKFISATYKNMHELVNLQCKECAYEFITTLDSVKNKHTGCLKCKSSYNEQVIENLLKDLVILGIIQSYKKEFKIDKCRRKRLLPFDFMIIVDNIQALIEVDGEQHFDRTIEFKTGVNNFDITQESDIIKTSYCYNNLIPLLRISYSEIHNNEANYLLVMFVNNIRVSTRNKDNLDKKLYFILIINYIKNLMC